MYKKTIRNKYTKTRNIIKLNENSASEIRRIKKDMIYYNKM